MNEKIIIVSKDSQIPQAVLDGFEANGWEIQFEEDLEAQNAVELV